jgi:hypothetical protein
MSEIAPIFMTFLESLSTVVVVVVVVVVVMMM